MRIDRQDQTRSRVVAGVVVTLGAVPIPDEQTIRIGEVLDVVLLVRVIQEAEVVGASAQAIVVAAILAILGDVRVEVPLRLRAVVTWKPPVAGLNVQPAVVSAPSAGPPEMLISSTENPGIGAPGVPCCAPSVQ